MPKVNRSVMNRIDLDIGDYQQSLRLNGVSLSYFSHTTNCAGGR